MTKLQEIVEALKKRKLIVDLWQVHSHYSNFMLEKTNNKKIKFYITPAKIYELFGLKKMEI